MSTRASGRSPLGSSGAMYSGVPSSEPVVDCGAPGAAGPSSTLAIPKSRTLMTSGLPATRTRKQFDGLMSRCTMPARCTVASAAQICSAIGPSRDHGSGPSRSSVLDRSSPCSSSITRYTVPSGVTP